MLQHKILLASRSPRRKELLATIIDSFDTQAPEADESVICSTPQQTVLAIARRKLDAAGDCPMYDAVIACDTLVYLDGEYFGKPKDEADAMRMLRALSGKTHTVVSGVAIRAKDKLVSGAVVSYVTFQRLTDAQIADYIAAEQPLDKAGSYAIQDGKLVQSYKGDYTNIVGMPVAYVKKALIDLGIINQ